MASEQPEAPQWRNPETQAVWDSMFRAAQLLDEDGTVPGGE